MRDNQWLASRLNTIHERYFHEVPIFNTILVRFGRASKTRFGSIIARPHKDYKTPVTYITINALFKDEIVPEYVIDATLAHEFAHYTHGFHSPLARLHKHPHRGSVVDKEIQKRGAGELLTLQYAWIKSTYPRFLQDSLAKLS